MPRRLSSRALILAGAALLIQSGYLAAVASPHPFYVANVLIHHYGGLLFALFVLLRTVRWLTSSPAESGSSGRPWAWFAVLGGVATVGTAIGLEILHNTAQTRGLLVAHIVCACVTSFVTIVALALNGRAGTTRPAWGLAAAGVAGLALFGWLSSEREARRAELYSIDNPSRPPLEMAGEAMGGSSGPFFPSSSATSTGGKIPSNFFMTSESCRRCHEDIYEQWESSAHHFSSFNNQWYRKSIEYMQEVNSLESAKWCAGCHDHAVLFNGMMDYHVADFIHTQEAHTGLGCNSCHAITHVKDTMGNGGFFLEYPPLHDLAVSENPLLRWLHDKVVELDPGPHKDVFLKPFHREQTAEFCASCHKVHLDVPVNNYRWLRGFNEYDNWQASGVSGMGARSFYYPPESMDCADCHMPLVASDDKGNLEGYVHDHSFLAANTALPAANHDEEHLSRTIEFLQNQQVTVDLFAAGPVRAVHTVEKPRISDPQLASTFAVGEEAAMSVGRGGGSRGVTGGEEVPVWGPLDRTPVTVVRGEEARVDVVVRTRGVGHFFPGGTIDAFDVWLELRAVDDTGRTIYWSGIVEDNGRGPVDESSHFYGARMVDGKGNRIDKRNAFVTRAVAWVNLIPPGAADLAHFRLEIPEDCGDEIHLEARLNYRKFSHANTMFSFAGVPAPGEPAVGEDPERVSKHYDSRVFVAGDVPENVSAEVREIPTLPIVVMAQAEATLRVADRPAENQTVVERVDALRWNDFGIGRLRQGDFTGARQAFRAVTEADPSYADGYVNVARVALQEGLLDDAYEALSKARSLSPELPKIHYFLGVIAKERGEYDEALERFYQAADTYPRDRVVRNAIGRVLFLQRRYDEAVVELQRVLEVDAEDLMAHYNLMLCYKGLGRLEDAKIEQQLYERFKADEDAPAILGPYLRENPEDNRMRQPIHEQRNASPELIERALALQEAEGEPFVVLPGDAEEFARRVVEAGKRAKEENPASRVDGPVEAGFVRAVSAESLEKPAADASRGTQ